VRLTRDAAGRPIRVGVDLAADDDVESAL